MTTAKLTRWINPTPEIVDVRVMAVVDGWAMVHQTSKIGPPFVVYKCDLKDIKESFTEMMVKAGRDG